MPNGACSFWTTYWGELASETIDGKTFGIWGFENLSPEHTGRRHHVMPHAGTLWGFVSHGCLSLEAASVPWTIRAGQWFCLPIRSNCSLSMDGGTRVFAMFLGGHVGLTSMGGPVEAQGRLRYIDGCTDTLLCAPPEIGEPCLNLLHFPRGVDQTAHFHPSFRSGVVNAGRGWCVHHEERESPLEVGMVFLIPTGARHKFKTGDGELDVISFHPDSDWGPTHETHPMINRTWGMADGKR